MNKLILIFSFLALALSSVLAQDTVSKKEIKKQKKNFLLIDRPWTVEVPIWTPGYAGSFAYGDIEVEGEDGVDPEHPIEPPPGGEFGKIISRLFQESWYLKFFFITRIAYEKNRVMFQLDGISGAVGESVKFKYNNKEIVNLNFQTINVRLFGGYKLYQYDSKNERFRYELFGYIGIRMHFHKVYSDLNGIANKLDISPNWVEPIIGVHNQFTFKRWLLILNGDYGGYFIDNKSSFQMSTYVYCRMGKVTSLKIGWNHLQLNHYGTIRGEDFQIKATFSGPSVGAAFHF